MAIIGITKSMLILSHISMDNVGGKNDWKLMDLDCLHQIDQFTHLVQIFISLLLFSFLLDINKELNSEWFPIKYPRLSN